MTPGSPAELPPAGLPGLQPLWSRLVTTPQLEGGRTWHLLDNQVLEPSLTLLCVHGNPTWSYLWRDLLACAPPGVRVIAVDQLDMGFSERTGTIRRLAQRIDDLTALTETLELAGPVVTVGHDWGGPVSLGWAQRNLDSVVGVVLANTAVAQPSDAPAPAVIRLVRAAGILENVCVRTPAFIRGALALARPRLDPGIRAAYEAPYRTADRRAAVGAFVEDIPLGESHPSRSALEGVAERLDALAGVPALLLWGTEDPVFSERYLRDLEARLPDAEVHRFTGAGHLVTEDADVAQAVFAWIGGIRGPSVEQSDPGTDRRPLWSALVERGEDDEVALVEMGTAGVDASITFAELDADVAAVASGLADVGIQAGDRVALLVPPGIDLATCVYACWRAGAVVVVADAGLGVKGMGRALQSANPRYVIGVPRALAAARAMRWPGTPISTEELDGPRRRALGVVATLDQLRRRGRGRPLPAAPSPRDVAAVGFTSGATGPAKGVVYRHHQMQAQRDALMGLYGIRESDRLVAAFGPFSLFGPSMGIASVIPDMEVTKPGSLTGTALASAISALDATLVFASPAALANVAATDGEVSPSLRGALGQVRLVMSAGAPVGVGILRSIRSVMPNAEIHTPYGMTEVLPVADASLVEIDEAGAGDGVCVGRPVSGVDVAISPLDPSGAATAPLTRDAGVVGEVCVRASHMRDGYDKLWVTEHAASQPPGWHRTGDVGHLDAEGRLWIEGRMGHIVTTEHGPVTPVGVEHAVGKLEAVESAAVVGVGPPGAQVVVVVVVPDADLRPGLAPEKLADEVRAVAGRVDVAAVLVAGSLPVDRRHNSKVDRSRVARWAERVLAGGRVGRL